MRRDLYSKPQSYEIILTHDDTITENDRPNPRIHDYDTYHYNNRRRGHGLVTMMKHMIPSEEAD